MVSLDKVSLTLPGPGKRPVPILHNISLRVQKGEAVSVVGPSGSGKTSLLMLIAGVEQASAGRLAIYDQDITYFSEDQLAAFRRGNIGIVFQNFHLIPTMTALENVSVALELAGHNDARQLAEESLCQVGLAERMGHYPEQISGGEQQRVALARAFATRPALLLADEPTGNLDSENSRVIIDLLFRLKDEYGSTLMLITHDAGLADRTSRRLEMQDGSLHEA